MARIEKTVFISYRRTDVYTALAVYENLKNQGYDVFFDYRSISSGDFEQIITGNIRARAHFLLILTPTALDRCNEPGDWLRREIELAIDEKRNIVPLFFKGFRFGGSSTSGISKWLRFGKPEVLTGKLRNLSRYNGLNVHEDYFEEGMNRLRIEFLSKPLDTVLHPVSTQVRKVVKEEQDAADEALKQRDDAKEPVKQVEEKPDKQEELENLKSQAIRLELNGDFWEALQLYYKIKKIDPAFPRVDVKISELEEELKPKPVARDVAERAPASSAPRRTFEWQPVAKVAGIVSLLLLFIWGGLSLWNTPTAVSTQMSQSTATQTLEPVSTDTPTKVNTPMPTKTTVPPTSTLTKTAIPPTPTSKFDIGSTMTGIDGMTLLYIPAGEFTMGSDDSGVDERPVHTVYLDGFWIDQTEVTNAMFAEFLNQQGNQKEGGETWYETGYSYFGFLRVRLDGETWKASYGYDFHPVSDVTWYGANAYCSWVGRRLPTEAEWEKAARGGLDGKRYPWGDEFPSCERGTYNGAQVSVCNTNTVPVASFSENGFGLYDMQGNVSEWVSDWYESSYYENSPEFNPKGPSDGDERVKRGGSFHPVGFGKIYDRIGWPPHVSNFSVGFRCAMDAE